MIPQDAVLFTGILRNNIDPFENYSSTEIVECLKKVGLIELLKSKQQDCQNLEDLLKLKVESHG